jgi:hypothetical protein
MFRVEHREEMLDMFHVEHFEQLFDKPVDSIAPSAILGLHKRLDTPKLCPQPIVLPHPIQMFPWRLRRVPPRFSPLAMRLSIRRGMAGRASAVF